MKDPQATWSTYQPGTCPDCGAEYPDFHSPKGEIGAFCDACGYASADSLQRHEGTLSQEWPLIEDEL